MRKLLTFLFALSLLVGETQAQPRLPGQGPGFRTGIQVFAPSSAGTSATFVAKLDTGTVISGGTFILPTGTTASDTVFLMFYGGGTSLSFSGGTGGSATWTCNTLNTNAYESVCYKIVTGTDAAATFTLTTTPFSTTSVSSVSYRGTTAVTARGTVALANPTATITGFTKNFTNDSVIAFAMNDVSGTLSSPSGFTSRGAVAWNAVPGVGVQYGDILSGYTNGSNIVWTLSSNDITAWAFELQ